METAMHGRDKKCIQIFLSENVKGRDNFVNLSVGARIILRERCMAIWNDFIWFQIGTCGELL
jgi:hypothetical protein